ncbi:MAG: substrate-binding domain-containing protein [Phycisphaerae bacterium]
MSRTYHVALQFRGLPPSYTDLRVAVGRWAAMRGDWDLHAAGTDAFRPVGSLRDWDGDGAIVAAVEEHHLTEMASLPFPAVNISHRLASPRVPHVWHDEEAIGRTGGEHLLEAGHRNIAFLGNLGHAYSEGRRRGAADALADRGLLLRATTIQELAGEHYGMRWERLDQWIRDGDFPQGVICANDSLGRQVTETCRGVGIDVPDQVAVVSVDDAVGMCELSIPPLSSVRIDTYRLGWEACSLLQQLMDGEPPPETYPRIAPLGVTVRQSSDALAIDDAQTAAAVRFIRNHAREMIDVNDVLREVPAARRSIERKFRRYLGRSPWQEIRRVQIEHVKQLLRQTDWPIGQVAEASAFRDPRTLSRVFRKETGLSPRQFRNSRAGAV